jgi:hypothetical protein
MASLVGRVCRHWLTTHDVLLVALVDAHEKADALHCDVSLGNIILCKLKEGTERVGYLIDWELSCKRSRAMARGHALTVRLILLTLNGSPDAFEGDSRLYVQRSADMAGTRA